MTQNYSPLSPEDKKYYEEISAKYISQKKVIQESVEKINTHIKKSTTSIDNLVHMFTAGLPEAKASEVTKHMNSALKVITDHYTKECKDITKFVIENVPTTPNGAYTCIKCEIKSVRNDYVCELCDKHHSEILIKKNIEIKK